MSTYLSDYDYFLPEELIGQKPREPRDSAKLMLINRKTGEIEHKHFYNIIDYLQKGDVLVRNATKVIPARIYGHKESGGVLEVLLIKRISKPRFAVKFTGKVYHVLKVLDLILLCIGLAMIIFNDSKSFATIISFAIWGFAVIEWINYYKVQLSYSLNPIVLFKYILQGELRKSRIAKEIDKSLWSTYYHD